MKNRKNHLYILALSIIMFITLFNYSCSNEEYNYEKKTEVRSTARMQISSMNVVNLRNALIDSVANSAEFWEFTRYTQLLSEKFDNYTAMWSNEKFDHMMSNLNNDEYAEDFIEQANLMDVLLQVDKATENLRKNTVFLELNESERNKLFLQHAEGQMLLGRKMMKTPRETGNDPCEDARQTAYVQAQQDYDNAIANCSSSSSPSYLCRAVATAAYNRSKKIADENYEECKKK